MNSSSIYQLLLFLFFHSCEVKGTSIPVYRNPHVVCQQEEELCGRSCYTPSKQQCLAYSDGSGRIVCSNGDTFCGGQCLSATSGKACIHFSQHGHESDAICNPDDSVCGWKDCYSPESQLCLDDRYICSKGDQLCGRKCYTPSEDTYCSVINHWLGVICKNGEKVCGGQECYRTEEKFCFEDKGILCNLGEEVCGSGTCFKSGDDQVCIKDKLLCKIGEEGCGNHCYNPNNQTCYNEDTNLLCAKEELNCGNYKCYNVSAGDQCFQQEESTYYAVCTAGQKFCGSYCYDPKKEICFETSVKGWGKLCPLGSESCGKGFETNCYEPSNGEICHDTGDGGQFACKQGESLCGRDCYKEGEGKSCVENKVLCNSGDALCGGEFCYNSVTSKCLKIT